MSLGELLKCFTDDELVKLIPNNLKAYLDKVSRDGIYEYVISNFFDLLNDKNFIINLIVSGSKYDDLELLKTKLLFTNSVLNKESKKEILEYFAFKESKVKRNNVDKVRCVLLKRFYELLDYQFLIKEKVINFIENNDNNTNPLTRLIIHMPTGTGKTKTAIHTIVELYQRLNNSGCIVWLAHTNELLEQAKATFIDIWKVLGNREINIIEDNNLDKSIIDKDSICFLSYQKIISLKRKSIEIFLKLQNEMRICVCDEAHKCLAQETYQAVEELLKIFNLEKPKTLIGLTATPGRKYNDSLLDGENLELAEMFDKHIFSINTGELKIFKLNEYNGSFSYNDIFRQDNEIIKYFQDRQILAKIKRMPIKYNLSKDLTAIFSKTRDKDYTTSELSKIGEDYARNTQIIEKLKVLAHHHIPTILFACSNEQGKLLSSILSLLGIKNRAIFGDTNLSIREKAIMDFNHGEFDILINNAILTTGFDSPRIKCVFVTRPTNSIVLYSQMLGRGLRGPKMGGNDVCLLVDLEDNLNKFNDENFAFNYFSCYWR